jgi:hypothetical protein
MPERVNGVNGAKYVAGDNVWGEWLSVWGLIQFDHVAQLLQLADHFFAFGS